MVSRIISSVVVGLLLLAIAGCGFQLRGTALMPDSLKTMYIQGIDLQQGLGLELKRALARNDVTVLPNYQEDSAVLTILENKYERRVLSVATNVRVSEFQLYGQLLFNLTDQSNKLLIDAESLEAVRDYRFDQDNVLASDEEELILRENLQDQLVQSLLRRLSAIQ